MRSTSVFILAYLALLASATSLAATAFNIVVIGDGPNDRLRLRARVYENELLALTGKEFDLRVRHVTGDWSAESLQRVLDEAYADPSTDLLLVTGFIANQVAARQKTFPKPTFLPVLLDNGVLPNPPLDQKSAIPNLNYLTVYTDFEHDLQALRAVASFHKLALMMDESLAAVIPDLRQAAAAASRLHGIELIAVTHDGSNHNLMSRVPAGVDAIFVAGLPRMPQAEFDNLVAAINAAKIPSYSFVGIADVASGLLMTSSETRDIERQARLNALNMQAVMLGGRAEDQPVSAFAKQKFTINMETARQLGISPSFDVLNYSTLLNERPSVSGRLYGLQEIAIEALDHNQDLQAQRYALSADAERVRVARAGLLPQVQAAASHDLRRVTPKVDAGLFPERTTDASLSVQQVLYADSAAAAVTIERNLQMAREAEVHANRLSIVQAATTAYYSVLNSQSQLAVRDNNLLVTQRNLELARDRVKLGSSSATDVFRWQAEEAQARILVLNARAEVNLAWIRLNRLLHREHAERLALRAASFDEPFVMPRAEFEALVSSPADYARFSEFFVIRGLGQAPELAVVDAQIAAQHRDLASQRRSYWLPDFTVGGRYTNNVGQSGAGVGPTTGENLNDWTVGLQATLPLFSGGERRASVSRAGFELRKLQTQRVAIAEKVEEEIRAQLFLAQAGYGQIDLSAVAAEASRRNYELVADAYARGTVSILQLLDAQDASLAANASSTSSLYNFLITIMSLQRAVGGFDYLLPENERVNLANALRDYLKRPDR